VRLRSRHHRRHRHHPADRHRQEKRHHDDRFRAGGGARRGPAPGSGDPAGLPAALPPDPDDDFRRHPRRPAADAGRRRRLGTAPAARLFHRRRPDLQPSADPVHHAGDLSLFRPPGDAFARKRRRRRPADAPGRDRERGMNISAPFIRRPVATTLLTIGIALAGGIAFFLLPVAPLPQIDIPTVTVNATLPGASPETVANSVAEPLERHLGQIADVTEMTSTSSLGQTRITLQFGLNRDIDGAARDVQAGISAARADLPTALRSNPTYRKVNPADAPILILSLTSKTLTRGQLYDAASNVLQQRISQIPGIGQVIIG